MKRYLFSAITFVLVVVIIFTVGEICFRIFRGPPNPLRSIVQKENDYLIEPNTVKHNTSSVEGEFEYTAHINAHGYRGEDFSVSKEGDRARIFVVGDSFTFGVGAQDDETIPFLIQKSLQDRSIDAEVINAGIGHAGALNHYINIRDIHLKYKPDMVLLLFDLTDVWDDWHAERNALFDEEGEITGFDPLFINGRRSWWLTSVSKSAFCLWIHNKIVRSVQKISHLGIKRYAKTVREGKRAKAVIATSEEITSDKVVMEYDGLIMMRGLSRKEIIDRHWQRSAKYITKIKSILDEKDIPLIVVMYPHGIYVGPQQWKDGRLTWGFEAEKVYKDYYPFELVEQYAKSEGIPFINVLDDFRRAGQGKYFFDWDGHMTPLGYRVVAQGIVEDEVFKENLNKLLENSAKID